MQKVIHEASTRGTAFFGWLHSRHSFSFGRYFDPSRMNFGALRVLNDDIVEPGQGFGTHPHDNMEIVSIPLSGALAHKDSTGNTEVINTGDVQIMSAGSGITHSEFNHSESDKVNFLQLWVMPKLKNIEPRYDQKTFAPENRINQLQTVVAPNDDQALWINQDSWFRLSSLQKGHELKYELEGSEHGVYVFVIQGNVEIDGTSLSLRDGLGISNTSAFNIVANDDSELLFVEIPMAI